jgi:16S rRNA (guanine527-N7)-methyltransferase
MDQTTLMAQLERARSLGFLGPGPVLDHVEHAAGFVAELAEVHGRVIDLGSGGGVPGLVVAVARPDLEVILVDAMGKRCRFLEAAVDALGVGQVIEGRAEVLGRGALRGTASAVLARSFGPPAATAECAAPLLRLGGLLLVSEPPESDGQRWPSGPLAELGLSLQYRTASSPVLQVLEQTAPCPERYPRRDGVPGKRLLF